MTPSLPGNALMPLIGGAISYFFGWQSLFFAMGLLCISAGSASLYYLHYREQQSTPRSPKKGKKRPVTFSEVFENLYRNIFSNRVLWLLSSAYFFVYVIRSALSDWSVMYFVEHKGNPLCRSSLFRYSLSLISISSLSDRLHTDVGGVCDGVARSWRLCGCIYDRYIKRQREKKRSDTNTKRPGGGGGGDVQLTFFFSFSGWISDKAFSSRRGPPIALFLVLSLFTVALTWFFSDNKSSYMLDCALLLVNGYSIYGPQVLV